MAEAEPEGLAWLCSGPFILASNSDHDVFWNSDGSMFADGVLAAGV